MTDGNQKTPDPRIQAAVARLWEIYDLPTPQRTTPFHGSSAESPPAGSFLRLVVDNTKARCHLQRHT